MPEAPIYDLAVIGGGINGTGIACDAAGRGLKVVLIEKNDLASATSSASSKLIHGGLRYLETYEFRMVREALGEREILLKKAPHIIWPMRFVLPHVPGVRPRWMVRAGLFLYDNLARRDAMPGSSAIDLTQDPAGRPLVGVGRDGFCYWDCWVDDARLVVLNAMAARDKGALILPRTVATAMRPADGHWAITTRDNSHGASTGILNTITARVLVNAAGPWADKVDGLALKGTSNAKPPTLRLVKGSHIIVPRIPGATDAYLLQNDDRRVVFVLPYEDNFTLIGTTDLSYDGDPATVEITPDEEDYLLAIVKRFFARELTRGDIVWRYSGVRPLYDDDADNVSKITRDYRLELYGDATERSPPRLSVYGGKVTTYRHLAEDALGKLARYFPKIGPAWTTDARLPGGDGWTDESLSELLGAHNFHWDDGSDGLYLRRLARRHGALTWTILGTAKSIADLGRHYGQGLYQVELDYLRQNEWAMTADDVLWRRTKLGLHMTAAERQSVAEAFR